MARHGYFDAVDAGADADRGLTVRGLLRVDGTAPHLQHSLGENGWRSMWGLESQVGWSLISYVLIRSPIRSRIKNLIRSLIKSLF